MGFKILGKTTKYISTLLLPVIKINHGISGCSISVEQWRKAHLSRSDIGAVVPSNTHVENMDRHEICPSHPKNVVVGCILPTNIWQPLVEIVTDRNRQLCIKPISNVRDKQFFPKSHVANPQYWHCFMMIRALANKFLSSLRNKSQFTGKSRKENFPIQIDEMPGHVHLKMKFSNS